MTRGLRLLQAATLAGALLFAAVFLILAALRIPYPFELEWTEGRMLRHVQRIAEGEKVYAEPSIDFVAIGYPPFYYYASYAASFVAGVGFPAMRLVSFLATLATIATLFDWVRRETRDLWAAALAACLYAATYRLSGAWFDVARPDALMLAFLMGALYAMRFLRGAPQVVAVSVLTACAVYTKQTALPALAPAFVWLIRRDWKQGIATSVVTALLGVAAFLALDAWYAGWYRYYAVEMAGRIPLAPGKGLDFWRRDLFGPLWVALGFGLTWFFMGGARKPEGRFASGEKGLVFAAAAGMLFASWIGKWSVGGYDNALMPACAVLALLFGLGVARARADAARSVNAVRLTALLCVLVALQFARLVYDPRPLVPTQADRAAGERLVERLEAMPGDVFVDTHPYLGVVAGKRPFASSHMDITLEEPSPHQRRVARQIDEAVRAQRFTAIVFNAHALPERWRPYYEKAGPAFDSSDVFWPATGYQTRPKAIFVPCEGAGEDGAP